MSALPPSSEGAPSSSPERSVLHPRIRPGSLEERAYQSTIAGEAAEENTLVVLPTGLGKTAIALRVIAEALLRAPTRSVLVLAPTRPLVEQHAASVRRTLLAPPPLVLTGEISPEDRGPLLTPPQVIVATPQVIANDLASGSGILDTLSLVVFDEAHRAVGDYPYVPIGHALAGRPIRVLAMTASPGARIERIREVWGHLGIERFLHRTAADPDVAAYTHAITVEPHLLPIPAEVQELAFQIRKVARRRTEPLHRQHWLDSAEPGRRELLELGRRLDREIAAARARGDPSPAALWGPRTDLAIAMKAVHAVELIETQGVEALRQYLDRQAAEAASRRSPALRGFLNDPDILEVTARLPTVRIEHPKMATAVRLVEEEIAARPGARVIVFTQYRQTAEQLVGELAKTGDGRVRAVRFVGQGSRGTDEGIRQRDQVEILDRFRRGEINCLVATSVAEEGLDIPETDLVVLYEPVPDEIRTIQRRGRTGRARAGRALVLVGRGTRDEGMLRAAEAKERRMHEMLERVQAERPGGGRRPPPPRPRVQSRLTEFAPGADP